PGRRVEKHELDAEGKPYNRTTFLWDGMRLAQECRLGRSSSLYIYSDQGSHEPLARVDRAAPGEADEVLYYHTDVNGAPEEMTDGRGNIVWEAGYQVWGNLTHEKETRPVQQNLRFQGQYLDRETGLHYNLYRFYDPDIGKFISGDPISLRGGINLYAYAPNPLSWIDPLGLANRPNNGKYNIFHDYSLDPKYKYSSDGVQFNRANTDFINRMNSDPSFRRDMLGRHPALGDWLKNPNKASSPPGLTWHHHEDVNRLVLVDRIDHADNQGLYHPTGKGGRDMWGGGELGRRGKLDGVTGKPRGRRCG
ncbi:RHS domain-containing protein, partial [Salmonella enterica subsp. enterica serovar Isangi]|uniref:RHS repeat-associated core domain-containing protein n=2 Tax=Salmonella enterica TaxID=28901 RepID=UPI0024BDA7EA